MSRQRRVIPLPTKGIDARSTFAGPDTWQYAVNVRQSEADTRTVSYLTSAGAAGTISGKPRNLMQVFAAPSGVANGDVNKLLMLTTASSYVYNNVTATWNNIEGAYNLTGYGTRPIYPRFAVANSRHQVAWTCAEATPPIPVRIFAPATNGIAVIVPAYSARYMIAFNNRLVLGDTMESGVRNSSRLRWCVNGNFTDWTGLGSGFLDVGSHLSSGRIQSLNLMDDIAVVALEHEFIELLPTNSLFPVFQLGTHHRGPMMIAPRSWQVYNDTAFFLGADGVWAWNRSSLTKIGKPVERLMAGFIDIISAMSIQGVLLQGRGEYHLLLSSGTTEGQPYARDFIYDIKADRWFLDEVSSLAVLTDATLTYGDDYVNLGGFTRGLEQIYGAGETGVLLQERDTAFAATMLTPPDVILITNDYYAVDTQGNPSPNARNELINFYFHSTPNTQVVAGYSTDHGLTTSTITVTTNADGVGIVSAQVPFTTILFYFRRVGGQGQFKLTGAIEMEYEYVGETY